MVPWLAGHPGLAATTAAALSAEMRKAAGLTTTPVMGNPRWVWHPGPLPPLTTDGRPILIVLSPHPDDETLSLGVVIANAEQRGERVIVVAMTDGASSRAFLRIAPRWDRWERSLSRRPRGTATFTRADLAGARIVEMRAAVAALGVSPADFYQAHLDAASSDDGARTTVAEAEQVIRTFAARFPDATFATMSYLAERQPDHLDDGTALHLLVRAGVVRHALWAVSRLWWHLPAPGATWVVPSDPQVLARVLAAARAYGGWAPAADRLGVGWTSVRSQFLALLADPRDKVHPLG
jgi:LmbE family N-acetylglucosaminyl deacetylase